MKKVSLLFLALAVVFVFSGCPKRIVTAPEPPKEIVQEVAPVAPEKKEEPVAVKVEPKKVETVPIKEVTEVKPIQFGNIHFDFDKYFIREDARPTLKAVADWLIRNKDARMTLEGHADERGTNEYNLALGERRAKSAKDYIVAAGVKKGRLDITSYGEGRPLCRERNEDCWQRNRRVQFISGTAGK